jgi:hypothetical protein
MIKYSAPFIKSPCTLFGYQKYAVARMHMNQFRKGRGILLADEMGLGKVGVSPYGAGLLDSIADLSF